MNDTYILCVHETFELHLQVSHVWISTFLLIRDGRFNNKTYEGSPTTPILYILSYPETMVSAIVRDVLDRHPTIISFANLMQTYSVAP